jgi:hypothetical protein
MDYETYVSSTFLRLSVFAALAIFATIMTTVLLTQIVSASSSSSCCDDYDHSWGCDYWECEDCGGCWGCASTVGEVAPSKPADRFEQETVWTTVRIHNTDTQSHHYDLSVYLCESDCSGACSIDVTDCKEMRCETGRIYVPSGATKYVECSRFVRYPGFYRVKVEYKTESSTYEWTSYSDSFEVVSDCEDCVREDGYKDFRCFGNFLQERYRNDDCEWRWRVVEYCEYGCANEECLAPTEPPKTGEPVVFTEAEYEIKRGDVVALHFSVQNNGGSDTFDMSVGGEAADWVDVPEMVDIAEGDTKHITAYAVVPIDAEPGMHEFTITATAKESDSAISFIRIMGQQGGLFSLDFIGSLMLLLVVVAILVVVLWFRKRYGLAMPGVGSVSGDRRKEPVMSKSPSIRAPNRRIPERFRSCKETVKDSVKNSVRSAIKLLI